MAVKKARKSVKSTSKATPVQKKSGSTVKKSATKTTRPTKTTQATQQTTPQSSVIDKLPETANQATRSMPTLRLKKVHVIIALAVILLLAGLYAARGFFIAATVNGQPILRTELIAELERQSGKQTLDSLVTKSLILQEADKQNVQVSDEQVDDEIKKIEDNLSQQGQTLDQVLELQGLTRESLRDQVRVQKTVEILLGREIVVTEAEVTDYIASNSAALPQEMEETELKTMVEQQLRNQKLSERFQTWLQDLRQNANIDYLVNY